MSANARSRVVRAAFAILAVSVLRPGSIGAQTPGGREVPSLGGAWEERYRLEQLLGRAPGPEFLLRRPSALLRVLGPPSADTTTEWLAPELRSTWNSTLPFSFNDGALWAGRGLNLVVTAGVRERVGPLTLVLAPELIYEANGSFQVVEYSPTTEPTRHRFAHPYHPPPESIDWPIRFGDAPRVGIGPGQSSLSGAWGPVEGGVATENVWWGPGIRNALVLGNQGPGFPHFFLGSSRPYATPLGALSWSWLVGRLDESDYFDFDESNDHRSLSALAITLRLPFDPGLTVGASRMVLELLGEDGSWLGSPFAFLRSVGRPNTQPSDTLRSPPADQVFSVFGRWVVPDAGFEAYAEWARFEEPASLRDFLEFPQHSQGYTIGFQLAERRGRTSLLRLQAEATNLEPSATWRYREVFAPYTSRSVPHGFTHRGQPLGAAIGPGASSQWASTGFERLGRWRAGAFAGRIRWDAASLFSPLVPQPRQEDVSLFWGVRGALGLMGWWWAVELSHGVRLNYLFQAFPPRPGGHAEGVDVPNTSLTVTITPDFGR